LFRSTPRPNSHSRGFTLVESLVALAIMMIVLSAIAGLSASSLRSGRYVERHIAPEFFASECSHCQRRGVGAVFVEARRIAPKASALLKRIKPESKSPNG
jgi:prepilin-type N-terminal cleavage/methylation domain-containing protein